MEKSFPPALTEEGLTRVIERVTNAPAEQVTPDIMVLAYALETGALVINTAGSDNNAALNSLAFVNEQLERVGLLKESAQAGVMELITLSGLNN